MKKYFTGLIAKTHEIDTVTIPNGAGWKVSFEKNKLRDLNNNDRELIIHTTSWHIAQKALDLIITCNILWAGEPGPFQEMANELIPFNENELETLSGVFRNMSTSSYSSHSGIPASCAIAAKASRKTNLVYAIMKYRLSTDLFCMFSVDMEPGEYFPVSKRPLAYITYANAILNAHSIMEDLGLEIRANSNNPSRLKNGEWNPVVKEDLENRLIAAGVDLNVAILWAIRTPANRRIEKKRKFQNKVKQDYCRGSTRDSEISILEAISYADWLRDKVAAHKTRELTQSLSPYDVINVQQLSRQLILESLGWWKILMKERTNSIERK